MRIAICGSMAFAKEMLETKRSLEKMGHRVAVPGDTEIIAEGKHDPSDAESNYKHCIETDVVMKCLKEIEKSDAILVLNHPKKGIEGYVGANTLIEIGLAYYFGKKIFLLYEPPCLEKSPHTHEIQVMRPIVINGDLKKIT